GELGLSTIEEHPHLTKIGFADSQTLFTSSDREKLGHFFKWIGLKPGEQISNAELLAYFRIWASKRDDLTPGAAAILEEEEPTQLVSLLASTASAWRGVSHDDFGRLESNITLTLSGPPHIELGLAAPCPPGFPNEIGIEHMGRTLQLSCESESDDA